MLRVYIVASITDSQPPDIVPSANSQFDAYYL